MSEFKEIILGSSALKFIQKWNNPLDLQKLLDRYVICQIKLKVLSALLEKFLHTEVDLVKVLKTTIWCIPKGTFRYMMTHIAGVKSKTQIYYYCLKVGRYDLLSSVRGLKNENFETILKQDIKLTPKVTVLLEKQFGRTRRKQYPLLTRLQKQRISEKHLGLV